MSLLAVPGHLLEVAAALFVLGASAGVGRALLGRLGASPNDPLEELLFSTALGSGVVATAYLVQGFLGALQPVAVWATLVILAALAHRHVRAVLGLVRTLAHRAHRRVSDDPAAAGVAVVLLGAGIFLLLQALAPPTDWDSLMYHLEVPRRFLDEGRIFLPADNLHVTRVGLVHLLYLPLLAAGAASAPAVLSALMTLLLGLAVLAYGLRFLTRGAGLLATTLLWGTSTFLLVAVTPRVDATLALWALLGQHALFRALTDDDPGPPYLLAALLLGLGVGIKYHGLVVAAAAGPLILWVAWRRWRGAHRLRALGAFAAAAALAALPWLVKNGVLVGAPLYPFLAHPTVQPWLAGVLGSRAFPASVNPDVLDFVWRLREPLNLTAAFFHPGRLSIEFEGRWYYTAPALALLPLALLHFRRSRILWTAVPAGLYAVILAMAFPRANLRYFLPAAPALTLVTADALLRTLRRLKRPALTRGAVGLVVAVTLVPPSLTAWSRLSGTRAVDAFLGAVSTFRYMASDHDPSVSTFAPVLRFANDSLPPDATLLMLMDARGFPFRSRVLQDNKGTNWILLHASSAPDRCLEGTDITHVLLGKGSLSYYVRGGLDPSSLGFAGAFHTFADRCLTPIYEDRAFVVFRVRTPSSRASSPSR